MPAKRGSEHHADEFGSQFNGMTTGIESRLERREVAIAPSVSYRLSQGLLLLLMFLFALQVFHNIALTPTPLLCYLSANMPLTVAVFTEEGVFPPGYPALLAVDEGRFRSSLGHRLA